MTAIGLARQMESKFEVIASEQRADRFEREMAIRVVDLMKKLDDVRLACDHADEFAPTGIETARPGYQEQDPSLDFSLCVGSIEASGGAWLGLEIHRGLRFVHSLNPRRRCFSRARSAHVS
jgi:hypothetical protein